MGEREFGTKLYYQLSLDGLVPQDQRLCRIARAVDFAFVRRLCRPFYSHTGQPSVDPVVIFKMLLIGYLYGITSERRLPHEVTCIWLSAGFWATTSMCQRQTIASSPRRAPGWAAKCSRSSSASRLSSAGRLAF